MNFISRTSSFLLSSPPLVLLLSSAFFIFSTWIISSSTFFFFLGEASITGSKYGTRRLHLDELVDEANAQKEREREKERSLHADDGRTSRLSTYTRTPAVIPQI